MFRGAGSAVLLAACATSQRPIAGAPAMTALPLGEMAFDCDAADGHTSIWTRTIDTPSGQISGQIHILFSTASGDHLPYATVMLGGDKRTHVGLGVEVDPRAPNALMPILIRTNQVPEPVTRLSFLAAEGARFTLRWDPKTMSMQFPPDREWFTMPFAAPPERLWLECANAEVLFHAVALDAAQR